MMKQAQQMQERLQKQMAELRVEGNAGGGMVTVVVNGAKQIQSLKIDPEAVSKDDVEMLQDLILAAVNDAQRKVDDEMSQKMGGMIPGGLKANRDFAECVVAYDAPLADEVKALLFDPQTAGGL